MESRVQPVYVPQPGSPAISSCVKQMSASIPSIDEVCKTPDKSSISNVTTSPKLRHNSTPSLKDLPSAGTAIARPRASANKNVNLMDAQPWQLLPPPSSKMKMPGIQKTSAQGDNMGSNASISSSGSVENTLVAIDRSREDILGVRPFPPDDIDSDSDKLKIRPTLYHKNLSKEKSRSIDSLRSDISESSEFSWRRSMRHEPRAR